MGRSAVRGQLRTLLGALSAAAGGILAAGVLTFAAGVTTSLLDVDLGLVPAVVLTLVLTAGVAFGGVSAVYLSIRGLDWSFIGLRVPSPADLAWVGGGYLLALLSVVVATAVVGAAGGQPASNQLAELGIEAPALLLLLIPVSLFIVGPGEELLFRGIVQGTLREAFGPAVAVVLASAIFAGVHYLALTGGASARLTTIAILFLPSLVFGAAYERTGNLAVPVLIHGLYNSTLVGLLYIALRFVGESPPV